jgi:hypothetical protein
MTKRVAYLAYVEDTKKHHSIIADAARKATKNAVRRAKQASLAITYVEGENIIKEYPKGRKKIIGTVAVSRKIKIGTQEKIS